MSQIQLYDTTLRDGAQREGISFSVVDKLHIAQRIDELGLHYIEGGWPGANPKDEAFYRRAAELTLKNARLTAFGSTVAASYLRLVPGQEAPTRVCWGMRNRASLTAGSLTASSTSSRRPASMT